MPQKTAIPIFDVIPGEIITPRVDVTGMLQGSEVIASVSSAADQTASGEITTDNLTRNSAEITLRGTSVAANKAVIFKATVDADATLGNHVILVTLVTNSSPAQTRKLRVILNVVAAATNT